MFSVPNWLANWLGLSPAPVTLGEKGEAAAAAYLKRKGLRIIGRSVADKLGEIDLIAIEKKPPRRLVFVEVKTRTDSTSDHPADRVDTDKQHRVTRAAIAYLKRHMLLEHPCRFDVVAVWWSESTNSASRIDHFEDAFEPVGVRSMFS